MSIVCQVTFYKNEVPLITVPSNAGWWSNHWMAIDTAMANWKFASERGKITPEFTLDWDSLTVLGKEYTKDECIEMEKQKQRW